jgi:hypothetical protein
MELGEMKEADISRKHNRRDTKVEELVERAAKDEEFLRHFLVGVSSPTTRVRFASAKALRMISEKNPDPLYPHWEFFLYAFSTARTISSSGMPWT